MHLTHTTFLPLDGLKTNFDNGLIIFFFFFKVLQKFEVFANWQSLKTDTIKLKKSIEYASMSRHGDLK